MDAKLAAPGFVALLVDDLAESVDVMAPSLVLEVAAPPALDVELASVALTTEPE